MIEDQYLGDGVYASFDGCCIVLDLRGQDCTTKIALEPAVFKALERFAKTIKDLRDKIAAGLTCADCGDVIDMKGHHVCTKAITDPRDQS